MGLTPEQFNKLITRDEFEIRLSEMESRLASKEDMNNVLGAVDAVMHKLDKMECAFVSNLAAHDRFEKRISRTEKELGLNPYFFSVVREK